MKNRLFALLLFISLNSLAQSDYLKYPSYQTILNLFFNTYSVADIQNMQLLRFEKKPDGWHVVLFKDYQMDTLAKDEIIWSLASDSFREIKFNKVQEQSENNATLSKYLNDWSVTYFNQFPYYNYRGFHFDVITHYKDATNLPDSVLYCLGRCYSYYAQDLLNDVNGMSLPSQRFTRGNAPNALSRAQVDEYNKYHNLAIETFKKVGKLNPHFQTLIGSIQLKTAMEYVVGYLDMMVYQNDTEAMKELPDNIFDDFSISLAKNYLTSCDSNTILFTDGDYDTFPLLYVQAKYKFRTDVLVANMSLLGTPDYINRLRRPFMGAQPLPLSLIPDELAQGVRDYVYMVDKENYEDMNIADAIAYDKSNDQSQRLQLSDGQYVNYIPTHTFRFNHGNDTMNWKIEGDYLFKEQMVLLDVMASNNWKRPICFTTTISQEYYTGLYNYFEQQGLVYKLVSRMATDKNMASEYDPASVNIAASYNCLMNKFTWKGFDKIIASEKLTAATYRISFSWLANVLVVNNEKDSALKVMNKCIALIPNEKTAYDGSVVYLVSDYYALNKTTTADSIARKLIYNLSHNINNTNGLFGYPATRDNRPVYQALNAVFRKYNRQEMINEMGKAE